MIIVKNIFKRNLGGEIHRPPEEEDYNKETLHKEIGLAGLHSFS